MEKVIWRIGGLEDWRVEEFYSYFSSSYVPKAVSSIIMLKSHE